MAEVWAVGGVDIPPAVTRMLAYVASGGAEGVAEPGGLKVAPLATPGTSVRVLPGAAVVRNRYAGGSIQSYIVGETTQATVPIAATGSGGGRTDLVIARVEDPQYAGSTPGARFEVVQGVPPGSGAEYAAALPYPALALARVTLPASTGTVQASHITDLRQVAQPRRASVVRMGGAIGATVNKPLTASAGAVWPGINVTVDIPAWATHMSVIATIASIGYQNGSVTGTLAVRAGAAGASQWRSSNTTYDLDVAVGDGARTTLVIGGDDRIDPALRGTIVEVAVEGSRLAYTGSGALITRPGTHVVYQIEFREQAS